MPDKPIELTEAEREFLARSGMSPERHAAIRDIPTAWGGRSIGDITAAIEAAETEETDR